MKREAEFDKKTNKGTYSRKIHHGEVVPKRTKMVFVATIQIAVCADTVSDACKSVSVLLEKSCVKVIDWRYKPENGHYPDPIKVGEIDIMSLGEGDIFSKYLI